MLKKVTPSWKPYRTGLIAIYVFYGVTFLNLEASWLNKQLEQINLKKLQWENYIALQTSLGLLAGPTDNALKHIMAERYSQ